MGMGSLSTVYLHWACLDDIIAEHRILLAINSAWGKNRANNKEEARCSVSRKRNKRVKRGKNGPGCGKE